jgi:hypothetical protein
MFVIKSQNHNGTSIKLEGTPEEVHQLLRYAKSAAAQNANLRTKLGTRAEYAALRDIYGALSETVQSAADLVIPLTTAENFKIVLGPVRDCARAREVTISKGK